MQRKQGGLEPTTVQGVAPKQQQGKNKRVPQPQPQPQRPHLGWCGSSRFNRYCGACSHCQRLHLLNRSQDSQISLWFGSGLRSKNSQDATIVTFQKKTRSSLLLIMLLFKIGTHTHTHTRMKNKEERSNRTSPSEKSSTGAKRKVVLSLDLHSHLLQWWKTKENK